MTTAGLMTIKEAAEYIGVSETTIRRCIGTGQLLASNVGAGATVPRWKVLRKELDAFVGRRTHVPEAAKPLPEVPARRKRATWRGLSELTPDGHIPQRKPKPVLRLVK
jgi:excisionase family DNA binding protein